jgi:hypothetical protein
MAITEEMKLKRAALQELSNTAIDRAFEDDLDTTFFTVNMLLMKYFYNPKDEYEFDTFNGWKKKGYIINKGAKATLIWGQPLKNKKGEESEPEQEEAEPKEGPKNKFFPLAYLFRNDQVKKIEHEAFKPKKKAETNAEIENESAVILPF